MITEVKDLNFSYSEKPILREVSFRLDEGEAVSVLSPNGGGKTTLFRCILGIHRHYGGTISMDGKDTRGFSNPLLARHVAYVPQAHYPAFNYSVLDMVLMGTAPLLGSAQLPGRDEYEKARQALDRLAIRHLEQRGFIRLSGGEQRLVLIARALTRQAPMMILDEPTAELDIGNQHLVLSQVRSLRNQGLTILFSTHDPAQAYHYSDRVLALSGGRLLMEGKPQEVICPPVLHELYRINASVVPLEDGHIHISVDPQQRKEPAK